MIDLDNPFYYCGKHDERTKQRLERLNAVGAEDVGFGHFGVRNVVSGLYIERVWWYNDVLFEDYFQWFSGKIEKSKQPLASSAS